MSAPHAHPQSALNVGLMLCALITLRAVYTIVSLVDLAYMTVHAPKIQRTIAIYMQSNCSINQLIHGIIE